MLQPDNIVFDLREVSEEVNTEHPDIENDDLHLFLTLGIDTALRIRTSSYLLADRYASEEILAIVRYVSQHFDRILCRHTRYVYDEETQELKTEWRWLDDKTVLVLFQVVDLVRED